MNSISFDWSENTLENGEEIFDLACPNYEHHKKYGYAWETAYESTKDTNDDKCPKYEGCPCCEDDSGYLAPMMNYIYPIENDYNCNETTRVKVAIETNCVLVQNVKTDEWFLTLTGGGMDLSPSIAHAYMITQKWIPQSLLNDLKAGWCKDSLSPEIFKELRMTVKEQLQREINGFESLKSDWSKPIKEITQ